MQIQGLPFPNNFGSSSKSGRIIQTQDENGVWYYKKMGNFVLRKERRTSWEN